MEKEITKLPTNLIENKVKVILSTLGMNERYNSFEYLSFVITYMLKHNDESTEIYKKAVSMLQEKFSIGERAVTCGINKILKMCNDEKILTRIQFNLNKKSSLNKIRVLKAYILSTL